MSHTYRDFPNDGRWVVTTGQYTKPFDWDRTPWRLLITSDQNVVYDNPDDPTVPTLTLDHLTPWIRQHFPPTLSARSHRAAVQRRKFVQRIIHALSTCDQPILPVRPFPAGFLSALITHVPLVSNADLPRLNHSVGSSFSHTLWSWHRWLESLARSESLIGCSLPSQTRKGPTQLTTDSEEREWLSKLVATVVPAVDTLLPDWVVWPETQQQLEYLVLLASRHQIRMIPSGNRTNCFNHRRFPAKCKQTPIVSINLTLLNRIVQWDTANRTVTVEAGMTCGYLSTYLEKHGFQCPGLASAYHSHSTIGGLLATYPRSPLRGGDSALIVGSLQAIQVVTPKGATWHHVDNTTQVNGIIGLGQAFLGTWGTLGVIAQATFYVVPKSRFISQSTWLLPSWDAGLRLLRQISAQLPPGVTRCMVLDQHALELVQALENPTWYTQILAKMRSLYLYKWKRFAPRDTTLVYIHLEAPNHELLRCYKELVDCELQNCHGYALGGLVKRGFQAYLDWQGHLWALLLAERCIVDGIPATLPWSTVSVACRAIRQMAHRLTQEFEHKLWLSFEIRAANPAKVTLVVHVGWSMEGRMLPDSSPLVTVGENIALPKTIGSPEEMGEDLVAEALLPTANQPLSEDMLCDPPSKGRETEATAESLPHAVVDLNHRKSTVVLTEGDHRDRWVTIREEIQSILYHYSQQPHTRIHRISSQEPLIPSSAPHQNLQQVLKSGLDPDVLLGLCNL
ncbi:hypothetical protein IWQ61_001710 [Dispira simplex]|nr:hypothetical protein IWQ61_001710 [Dispira simplex]